jgi:sugar (pentulose or hexulose) kinase
MIIVLNVGLKNARCIAFSYEGKVLADASRQVRTYVSNEKVEQNPDEWRSLSWDVISEVTSILGKQANNIQYITVTTSASCLVVLNKNGKSLRNAILVSDTRSFEEARILSNTVEFQKIQSLTGCKSSPDLMLPKIMWLSKHEPNNFQKASHFLNVGDFLTAQLTGVYATDTNNALKFHYVTEEQSYPRDLLGALGVDINTLPKVYQQGSKLGYILPKVATDLGLPRKTQMVLSTYDALAAVVGNGAFEKGDGVDVSGTVTSFRVVTDYQLFDPLQRIYVTPHMGENSWLAGGSNNLGGGVIEWLRQSLFDGDENSYTNIENYSKIHEPCPGGLIFLPHLLGERTPVWNPDCRGVFFGLNRSHQKSHLVCAVLEGVAFSVKHIIHVLQEFSVPLNTVTVAGGLSRMGNMNQIKADVFGVPIKKFENFETTAIGAALIALVGVGIFNNIYDAFKQFCKIEKIYDPNYKKHKIYEEYFQLYLQVYNSLLPTYLARAKLLRRLQDHGVNEMTITENL